MLLVVEFVATLNNTWGRLVLGVLFSSKRVEDLVFSLYKRLKIEGQCSKINVGGGNHFSSCTSGMSLRAPYSF